MSTPDVGVSPKEEHVVNGWRGASITVGFALAVAMWLGGFVTHLPGVRPIAPVIAFALLAVLAAGGFLAGRSGMLGAKAAFGAGAIAGLINLLIVGSVVSRADSANELHPGWAVIVLGSLAFHVLITVCSAWLGRSTTTPAIPTRIEWLPRFALVTCAAALPVLLSGGLVTSTNTGLAVPDWPTSYSANMFLYPLAKMTGGIYYEHAHRLFGSLVGLTTLVLTVFVLLADRRALLKGLAVFAFLFVCAQGVLGGIRVTAATAVSEIPSPETLADNKGSLALAAIHGTTAQLFFALLCVLAAVLSVRWRSTSLEQREDSILPSASLLLLLALGLQLVLGSITRHFQHPHVMYTHVGFALIVFVLAVFVGFRASGRHAAEPVLRILGKALVHTTMLQVLLGLATLWAVLPYQPGKIDPPYAVILATAHQGVGAILLGTAAMLAVWCRRIVVAAKTRQAYLETPSAAGAV